SSRSLCHGAWEQHNQRNQPSSRRKWRYRAELLLMDQGYACFSQNYHSRPSLLVLILRELQAVFSDYREFASENYNEERRVMFDGDCQDRLVRIASICRARACAA